jgi:hypothetical protein
LKLLLAICSCKQHSSWQDAQRATWVKDIPLGIDFRYFVGHSDNLQSDEVQLGEDVIDPRRGLKLYPSLPAKVKLLCKWALDHEYSFLFKTDTDTLVNPKNLLASDFANHDYYGAENWEETGYFCSGGAGYWLSRKAMQIVVDSVVTSWAEDVFVALALKEKGILPRWDVNYRWKPEEVVDRNMATLHLPSALRTRPYDPAWMPKFYQQMKETECS